MAATLHISSQVGEVLYAEQPRQYGLWQDIHSGKSTRRNTCRAIYLHRHCRKFSREMYTLNGGFVGGFELRHFLFTVVKPAVILLASVFSAEMQQQEDKKLTL